MNLVASSEICYRNLVYGLRAALIVESGMQQVLAIVHRHAMGWHTYTSPQLPGLFVTGRDEDASSLKESLPTTIKALIEARGNRRLEYLEWVESYTERYVEKPKPEIEELLHVSLRVVDG